MEYVALGLLGVVALLILVAIVCYLVVIVAMFKNGKAGLGVTCLLLTVCGGPGMLMGFFYGWIKSGEWQLKRVMATWTGAMVLAPITAVVAIVGTGAIGTRTSATFSSSGFTIGGGPVGKIDLPAAPQSPRMSIDTGIGGDPTRKSVSSVAISADGKLAAAHGPGEKNNLQVWDLTTKQKIFETGNVCGGKNAIALSPDGKLLAYAGLSNVNVVKLPSGERLSLGYLSANTHTLRFSPRGDLLVACNGDTIVGWDMTPPAADNTGRIVTKPKFELKKADDQIRNTSDLFDGGRKIASNGKNAVILIWDISTGNILKEIKTGDHDWQVSLEVSPDGKWLASNCLFDPIQIWDVSTGKVVKTISHKEKKGEADALLFLPNGKGIIYTNADNAIVVQDIDSGAKRLLVGHNGPTWSLAVTPDGKTLVSGDPQDGSLKVWDLPPSELGTAGATTPVKEKEDVSTPVKEKEDVSTAVKEKEDVSTAVKAKEPPRPTIQLPRSMISTGVMKICKVAVTPDGKYAAVGPRTLDDKIKLQVWDLQKKQKIGECETASNVLAIAPDGKTVLCMNTRYSICAVNPAAGTEEEVSLSGSHAQISPQCDMLVVTTEDFDGATMKLVPVFEVKDLTSKKSIRQWPLQGSRGEALNLAVLWEGEKKVVSGHRDGSIKIWDIAGGKLDKTLTGGHSDGPVPVKVAISPDGKRIASGGFVKSGEFFKSTKIWDVATAKVVKTLGQEADDMWFLPDGKTLVYRHDKDVFVENLDTGARRKLPAKISGGFGDGRALALTPDGKTLVTCSENGALKVWDIQAP